MWTIFHSEISFWRNIFINVSNSPPDFPLPAPRLLPRTLCQPECQMPTSCQALCCHFIYPTCYDADPAKRALLYCFAGLETKNKRSEFLDTTVTKWWSYNITTNPGMEEKSIQSKGIPEHKCRCSGAGALNWLLLVKHWGAAWDCCVGSSWCTWSGLGAPGNSSIRELLPAGSRQRWLNSTLHRFFPGVFSTIAWAIG